jgi:pimeloyl-ACP methyl ester carboxylesterase
MKEVLYQDKKIYYRIYGSGKTVILLHGFGEKGDVWNNQIEYLKENYKLIVPDLPGSGKSEMIEDMSIAGMAEVIKDILDKEASPPSVLIGHSMGGYISLAFVKKYPEYLDAFGLVHSTAYADSEEKKTVRKKGIEFIKQHGPFKFLKTTIPNLYSAVFKEAKPAFVEKQIERLKDFTDTALIAYYTAMMERPDRIEVLKTVRIPVLFIIGEYDYAIPLEESLRQCHLPEKAYIHFLKKSGHMGMLEEPEKVNRILEDFLLQP